MIKSNIKRIIDRTFAVLPMYEEGKRSSVLVGQINSICNDLSAVGYYLEDVDKNYQLKISRCVSSLKALCIDDDDGIYKYSKGQVRKVILDVCGDLRRLGNEGL